MKRTRNLCFCERFDVERMERFDVKERKEGKKQKEWKKMRGNGSEVVGKRKYCERQNEKESVNL